MKWIVQRALDRHSTRRIWVAYREDLSGAQLFRTWKWAQAYAMSDGAL